MPALRRYAQAATAVAWLGAASCNSEGPSDFYDPWGMAVGADNMLRAMETPALQAFSQTAFPPILAALQTIPGDSLNGLLPPGVIGKTYVWSTTAHSYEPGSRTGAPQDGVRFILYRTAASGIGPQLPLVELGAVDLRDVGTGTTRQLAVQIVAGQVIVADYRVTGSLSAGHQAALAEGSIDGDVAHNPDNASSVTFMITMDADNSAGTNSTTLAFSSSEGPEIHIEYTLAGGLDHTLSTATAGSTVMEIELGRHAAHGSARLNGTTVGTVDDGVFNASDPTLRDSDRNGFGLLVTLLDRAQAITAPRLLKPYYMTF